MFISKINFFETNNLRIANNFAQSNSKFRFENKICSPENKISIRLKNNKTPNINKKLIYN